MRYADRIAQRRARVRAGQLAALARHNARKAVFERHLDDGSSPEAVVRSALVATGGNATRAASLLGFAFEEGLWAVLRRYGLTHVPRAVREEIARERQW